MLWTDHLIATVDLSVGSILGLGVGGLPSSLLGCALSLD